VGGNYQEARASDFEGGTMQTPEGYEKKDTDRYLQGINAYVVKPTTGGYGSSGHSDRICCIDGFFWGIEIKREGKDPTPLQELRMQEIRRAGGFATAGTADVVCTEIEVWRLARGLSPAKWMPE
jgi:hypothetical protein